MNRCIALFCRPSIPGQVKTRIAAAAGQAAALDVYRFLLENIGKVLEKTGEHVIVYSTEAQNAPELPWKEYRIQKGEGLGERMYNAFVDLHREGFEHVVLCGSDIPGLTERILHEHLDALGSYDMTIGPASDGGYYLIGIARESLSRQVFDGLPWSTEKVFNETMERAAREGLRVYTGPELTDLDTVEDLARVRTEISSSMYAELMRLLSG